MANGAVTTETYRLGRVMGGSGILFPVPMFRPSIHPDKNRDTQDDAQGIPKKIQRTTRPPRSRFRLRSTKLLWRARPKKSELCLNLLKGSLGLIDLSESWTIAAFSASTT
jgi:hypothetical protein